jgi:hypothetical protein
MNDAEYRDELDDLSWLLPLLLAGLYLLLVVLVEPAQAAPPPPTWPTARQAGILTATATLTDGVTLVTGYVTVTVPPGAVTQTTVLTLTTGFPAHGPTPPYTVWGGVAFALAATASPTPAFELPVTATVPLGETGSAWTLRRWDGSAWVEAACPPLGESPEDYLVVPICAGGEFVVAAAPVRVWLPLVQRAQ